MDMDMTLDRMNEMVAEAGYTPSPAGWEDEDQVYACSTEGLGPEAYGHPKFELQYRKDTGEMLHDNRTYVENPGGQYKGIRYKVWKSAIGWFYKMSSPEMWHAGQSGPFELQEDAETAARSWIDAFLESRPWVRAQMGRERSRNGRSYVRRGVPVRPTHQFHQGDTVYIEGTRTKLGKPWTDERGVVFYPFRPHVRGTTDMAEGNLRQVAYVDEGEGRRNPESTSTPVMFRKDKETGDIVAIFPYEEGSPGYMTSYSSTGQHSDASMEYVNRNTVPVKSPAQYADLKRELKGQGYTNLKVIQKASWTGRTRPNPESASTRALGIQRYQQAYEFLKSGRSTTLRDGTVVSRVAGEAGIGLDLSTRAGHDSGQWGNVTLWKDGAFSAQGDIAWLKKYSPTGKAA